MTGDQRVIPYIHCEDGGGPRRCTPDVELAFPPPSFVSFISFTSVASSCTSWPYIVGQLCKSTAAHISSQRGLLLHSQGAFFSRPPSNTGRIWMFTGPNMLSNARERGGKGVCSIFCDSAQPRPTPWTL